MCIRDRFSPDQQRALNLSYEATQISDKIESIGAKVFYKRQDLEINQLTNIFFPMTSDVNRAIQVQLDVDVPFYGGKFYTTMRQSEKAKLTLGVDYLRENRIGTHRDLFIRVFNPAGAEVNVIDPPLGQIQPDSRSTSIGVFAIEELQLSEKLNLLLAARVDNVSTSIDDGPFDLPEIQEIYNEDNTSDNDLAVSGNIGAKYYISDAFSVKANVANSFRGTDLFSKYHFTTVGAGFLVPNPDLDPERGVFYELSGQYKTKAVTLEANFYQNYLNNLFVATDLTFADAPSIQFQNIGEATITGFEWNAKVKVGTLSYAFVSGATINGNNDVTDNPLPEIPAVQSWLGFHYRNANDKFFVQPELLLVGDQNDVAPNEIETPGYAVFNIKAGLNLQNLGPQLPHIRLIASVTNLTDNEYRSHVSRGAPGNQNTFLEAGRSFNISFVARFGAAVR